MRAWWPEFLDHRKVHSGFYRRESIPSERDRLIAEWLDGLAIEQFSRDAAEYEALSDGCNGILLTFSERASAHAVRAQDPSILRRALLAIALACPKPLEPPSGYTELALCYRSAEILQLSPDTLFTAVPEWVSKGGRDWVAHFVTDRREANRLIRAFDYQEGTDGEGFRYVPVPRYKPARVHTTASDPASGWSMSSDRAL